MNRVLPFLFFLLIFVNCDAQKFLQLEKRGSFKTQKFFEGDLLTFKVVGDENWYEEEIIEILVEEQVIQFTNRITSIANIVKLRDEERGQVGRSIGNKIMAFGASFLGVSLVATVADWELKNDTWLISGSALATGGLLRLCFQNRNIKLGKRKRKRLRAMNLNFKKK